MGINDLSLAKNLTNGVEEACEGLERGEAPILADVTEPTAELLKWWFQEEYTDQREVNFHQGQRQAILNTIYAHEVLGTRTLSGLYEQIAPQVMIESANEADRIRAEKNAYPKYCLKMATGTGKTWVLQALVVWQVLNANRAPDNPRYTRNFLIVTPGLIVHDRLLDAFQGKERGGERVFEESDLCRFRELFIPETHRDEIFRFVQSTFCAKGEIGRKVTSGGLIAVTNWQAIKEDSEAEDDDGLDAPGVGADPKAVVSDVLPLTPGTSAGNDLNTLNRQFERGNVINYLRGIPDMLVFNDEAHRIHEVKKEGEITEVEWQKSLAYIAEPKGENFIQVDFTATPYNKVGNGNKAKKSYFPHIIVDFDLKNAMRLGLVKSLVLDKRSEIGALDNNQLNFNAERDDDGNPILSDGQKVMLRAGLTKLNRLERQFAKLDPDQHPKILVMCEDTAVTPLVEKFFKREEDLSDEEILRIDSNKKGELKSGDWAKLRERLFDLDRHKTPRVVVSVLMLREGFDVNNICVIVPLRSTQAPILLEQTIGRGLRLMWRGEEFEDQKRENRQRIREGKSPKSMIDVLSIVEHPQFQAFYDELMSEGLAGELADEDDNTSGTGDLIPVDLKDGYGAYDFAIPFILKEREDGIQEREFRTEALPAFDDFSLDQLKSMIGKGDKFVSEDVESKTRFGDYRVRGGIMTATGYNDFLGRIVRRIGDVLSQPISDSSKGHGSKAHKPYMQVNHADLAGTIDEYIRTRLFGRSISPLQDENWRVLLVDPVTQHIIKVIAQALLETEETETLEDAEIAYRRLSEVPRLTMRESSSLSVSKCIYPRLPYPARSGQLERAFIEMADRDGGVEAFCKIHEQKHDFARLRYVKEDGLPAFYSPDFLVRTPAVVYLVETKAQKQLKDPNVKRKRKAAVAWVERINGLEPNERDDRDWFYVLLGESVFYEWRDKGAAMAEMLDFARLRPQEEAGQRRLAL